MMTPRESSSTHYFRFVQSGGLTFWCVANSVAKHLATELVPLSAHRFPTVRLRGKERTYLSHCTAHHLGVTRGYLSGVAHMTGPKLSVQV
jgi:hypothetical protein